MNLAAQCAKQDGIHYSPKPYTALLSCSDIPWTRWMDTSCRNSWALAMAGLNSEDYVVVLDPPQKKKRKSCLVNRKLDDKAAEIARRIKDSYSGLVTTGEEARNRVTAGEQETKEELPT